jgi:LysR family transcriptional regulator, regulator for bpeEF and oprC
VDRFLLMTCFARAVETGSFSAAGRDLGIGQPKVSRYVAALEQHLGTRLMHRSTRSVTLTPEGERFYIEARRILDAMAEAESSARSEAQPSGLLRVACPTTLGRVYLLPLMRPLLDRYSRMELDVQISDRYVDLVDEAVDLAIRIGTLQDSALRARRIGMIERVCVASADYLARRGAPKTPDDLHDHDCVVYTLLSSGATWHFRDTEVTVGGRLRVNSPDAVHEAVLSGIGVGYGPFWLFEDALRSGAVTLLLHDHLAPPVPLQFVYAAHRLLPRRASVFMDFVAEAFADIPALNEGGVAGFTSGARPAKGKARKS